MHGLDVSSTADGMRRRAIVSVAAVGSAAAAGALLVRRRQLVSGATAAESHGQLAGDEMIETSDLTATRAISIRATTDSVWAWVAQLGQGRGGFYTYDFLENLVGCDIHSAGRIVQEWQDIAVGAEVKLHPKVPLEVAALELDWATNCSAAPTSSRRAPSRSTLRQNAAWPWLVQMGSGRGGAYTYDWIENLFGLGMHSANEILPQSQTSTWR